MIYIIYMCVHIYIMRESENEGDRDPERETEINGQSMNFC